MKAFHKNFHKLQVQINHIVQALQLPTRSIPFPFFFKAPCKVRVAWTVFQTLLITSCGGNYDTFSYFLLGLYLFFG